MNVYESIVSAHKVNRQAEEKIRAQKRYEKLESIKKETLEYIQSKDFRAHMLSLLNGNNSNISQVYLTHRTVPILSKCSYEHMNTIIEAFEEAGFPDVKSDYDDEEEEHVIILSIKLG